MPADNTERNARIVRLWNKGLTSGDIAWIVGASRNAVIGVINRARARGDLVEARGMPANIATAAIGVKRLHAERDENILALRNAGLSVKEIARRTGTSKASANSVIRRARAAGRTVLRGPASSHAIGALLDGRLTKQEDRLTSGAPTLASRSPDQHEPIGCRWIDGDVRHDWAYCNRATPAGESWCTAHRARVYRTDLPSLSRGCLAALLRII